MSLLNLKSVEVTTFTCNHCNFDNVTCYITDVIVDFKGEVVNVDQREVPDVKLLMWMECSISGHCDKQ